MRTFIPDLKKTIYSILSPILLVSLLSSSCGTSGNVVGSGIVQKRKYTNGWFVSHRSSAGSAKQEPSEKDQVNKEKEVQDKQAASNSNSTIKTSHQSNSATQTVTSDKSAAIPEESTNVPKDAPNIQVEEINNAVTYDGKYSHQVDAEEEANDESANSTDEKNKPAMYGFILFLASALFIPLGMFYLASDSSLLLILGLLLFLTALIFTILALTKYKHLKKRKIFAWITLYTMIITPLLLLMFSLIWAAFEYM